MDLSAIVLALAVAGQADPAPCTFETAAEVTVARVASNPPRWLDRCVRLSGLAQHDALYSGVEGFYLSLREDPASYSLQEDLRHRIGLYGEFPESDELESRTIAGIVDSCARRGRQAQSEADEENRRNRAAGDEDVFVVVMLAGYCHYVPGAVVEVSEVRDGPPARPERLVGERARIRFGNLVSGHRTWHRYGDFRRRAESFLAALRDGDRDRLSALHGRFGAHRSELDFLLRDRDSPFRELREAGPRPFIIFYRAFDFSGRPPEEQREQDGVICYCREADCDGRWPISTVDTGPRPDHPYACVVVDEDGAGHVFMRAERRAAPLREPASTAFRGSDRAAEPAPPETGGSTGFPAGK